MSAAKARSKVARETPNSAASISVDGGFERFLRYMSRASLVRVEGTASVSVDARSAIPLGAMSIAS